MDKIYILYTIFVDRNCITYKNTKFCNKYPQFAGTKESIEKVFNNIIASSLRDGESITPLSSKDVYSEDYFEKVIEIKDKNRHSRIYGISSCFAC